MMTTTTYTPGQLVRVKLNRTLVTARFVEMDTKYNKPIVEVEGRRLMRDIKGPAPTTAAAPAMPQVPAGGSLQVTIQDTAAMATTITAQVRTFDINVRFSFIEKMVDMVIASSAHLNSLLVTGSGGLGKSTTVMRRLATKGYKEGADYVLVKGFSTPKSLYRKLYENREPGSIIIFDDCDSVLQNLTAVNILKSCLDTSDIRTVSWLSERGMGGDDEDGGSLPASFDFEGKIIFISNLKLSAVPQPIRSRGLFVDVTMTPDEKIARMRGLLPHIRTDVPLEMKSEVVDFIERFRHLAYELSIRSLLQVLLIRQAEPRLWKDIAEYQLTTNPNN